jgi:hypothetical protein
MSRFWLAASLVFAMSSSALASDGPASATSSPAPAIGTHFARPPGAAPSAAPSEPSAGAPAVIAPPHVADRAAVRAALVRARARNLAAFRAYRAKGVFPSNTFKPGKLNVWRDADGHLCAAATIIFASGQIELVNQVAEQTNFIRLADVEQGPLMDWILTSGLTQDEIAAIQAPFVPVVDEPKLEPAQPLLVDAKLRKAEDARLRAIYAKVDRMIVKSQKKSLELATDRLMKNAELAWRFVQADAARS